MEGRDAQGCGIGICVSAMPPSPLCIRTLTPSQVSRCWPYYAVSMSIQSVLCLHSVEDGLTKARIGRTQLAPRLEAYTVMHTFVLAPGDDYDEFPVDELPFDLSHESYAPDVDRLTVRLTRLLDDSKADLLIVHGGYALNRFPNVVLPALQNVRSHYPRLPIALQGYPRLSPEQAADLKRLVLTSSDEIEDLIDAIF